MTGETQNPNMSLFNRNLRMEANSTSLKPQMATTTFSSRSQMLVIRNTKTTVSLSMITMVNGKTKEIRALNMFWQLKPRNIWANGKSRRTKTELSSSCSLRITMVPTQHSQVCTYKFMDTTVTILEAKIPFGSSVTGVNIGL